MAVPLLQRPPRFWVLDLCSQAAAPIHAQDLPPGPEGAAALPWPPVNGVETSVPGEGCRAPGIRGPELSGSPQALPVKVTAGKLRLEDRQRLEQEQQSEEKRLAIMMMKKREKYLYKKIMFGKKRKVREV